MQIRDVDVVVVLTEGAPEDERAVAAGYGRRRWVQARCAAERASVEEWLANSGEQHLLRPISPGCVAGAAQSRSRSAPTSQPRCSS
jgi:hypothetical protein